MSNETVVRVTADATGYMAELARAKTSAQAFAVSQDALSSRIKSAQDAITEATTNGSNASSRSVNAFMTSLARQADQAGRTRAEILQMQAAMLGVSDAAKKYVDAIAKADAAGSGGGHGGGVGIRREAMVMAHEAFTGNIKNLVGSSMVMAESLDLTKYLNPTTIALAAVAAGVVGVAMALNSIQKQVDAFNNSLKLTNDWAGVTRDSAAQLAQTVANQMGTSFGTAQANINATVASGRVLGEDLQTVTELAMDMAKQTGETFDKALEKVVAQSDGVQKAAEEWQRSHHDMSQATLDHIKAVDQAGDHVTALRLLYEQELQTMESGTTKHVSAMSAAWNEFLDGVGRYGRALTGNSTQADQIAGLKAQLSAPNTAANNYGMDKPQIQTQLDALEKLAAAQKATTEQTNAMKSAQESLSNIQTTVNTELEKGASNAEKRAKAEADANAQYKMRIALAQQQGPLAPGAAEKFASDRDRLIADANERYKDPKVAQPKQYHDDASTTMLQQLRDQATSLQAQLSSTDKLSDAQQQLVKFNQQISDWQGKTLTDAQKSLVAHQDDIRAQLQKNAAIEKELKDREDVQKLQERSAQIDAAIASYQANQQDQYSRQLEAFGMGSEAQKNVEAVKSIYTEYNRQMEQLAKATPKSLIGSDQYKDEISKIQSGLQQSLQLYDNYYSELKSKQADWRNGVATAMQDYIDSSANAAAQAQQTFTDGVKGMEDALINFAQTGKLSFSSMANSVIADIIRMQLRAAESGLFSNLAGIGGSLLGSFFSSNTSLAASTASALPGDSLSNMISVTGGFGTIGARAGGGDVSNGQAYYVGEQGPELFVPGTNGKIVPNHASAIGGSGGGDVQMQVINNSSAQVGQPKVTSDQNGKKFIRMVIDQAKSEIAGEIASGQGDSSKALTQRYGLNPRFR